jgi:hypothetical protein
MLKRKIIALITCIMLVASVQVPSLAVSYTNGSFFFNTLNDNKATKITLGDSGYIEYNMCNYEWQYTINYNAGFSVSNIYVTVDDASVSGDNYVKYTGGSLQGAYSQYISGSYDVYIPCSIFTTVGQHVVKYTIGVTYYGSAYSTETYTSIVNVYGGNPTYTTPVFNAVYGTKLSDLKFADTNFSWTSTDGGLPIGTYTRYASYIKPFYNNVINIPITITVTPYSAHFKMEVH